MIPTDLFDILTHSLIFLIGIGTGAILAFVYKVSNDGKDSDE